MRSEWQAFPFTMLITIAQPDHQPFISPRTWLRVESINAYWLWDSKRWKKDLFRWNTLIEPCLWISAFLSQWNSCQRKITHLLLQDCSEMQVSNTWSFLEVSHNTLQRLLQKITNTVWTTHTLNSRKVTVLRMFWKARRFTEFSQSCNAAQQAMEQVLLLSAVKISWKSTVFKIKQSK